MAHPIHKHMHTFITKQNVKAAIRDDKAHMDYLKRDVKDDQRHGGKYKDENQTADEKHISKLAGDVKYDEKKEGISRESAYQHAKNLEKYNPVDDHAGMSRKKKKESLPLGMTKEELGRSIRTAEGKETKRDKRRNKRDTKRTMRHVKKHGSGYKSEGVSRKKSDKEAGKGKTPKLKDLQSKEGSGPRVGDVKPGTITPTGGSPYKDKKKKGMSRKISKKAAERKVKKGKGKIEGKVGGKDPDFRYVSNRRQKRADKARDKDGDLKGFMKSVEIKGKARKIK